MRAMGASSWRSLLLGSFAASLLLSCIPEAPNETDAQNDSNNVTRTPAQLADSGAVGEGGPTSPDTADTSPATAPGLSAASDGGGPLAEPAPELAASAPPGRATAYWARSGRNVDAKTPWRSLRHDGIHDRESEAVATLQEPRRAFRGFPRANSGNYVDWAAALREGVIRPRARAGSTGSMTVLDQDILMVNTKTMPYVVFPHAIHTEWLACGNCHDWLFKKQAGATEFSMAQIFKGRQCGMCHGRVAFPPSECFRCHSGPRPK